jgi:hypothetical protein
MRPRYFHKEIKEPRVRTTQERTTLAWLERLDRLVRKSDFFFCESSLFSPSGLFSLADGGAQGYTVRVGAVRGLTGRSFVPREPDSKELSL